MKHYSEIIKSPVLTEKYNIHDKGSSDGSLKKCCFEVSLNSNKASIKKAFKSLFNQDPLSVNTLSRKGKKKSTRRKRKIENGFRSDKKIAIVTIPKDNEIDLFLKDVS